MTKYSQPDFYKFSQDSTTLANLVIEQGIEGSLLDICCGCAVIGIEIARKCQVDELYLVEKQEDYQEYIQENLKTFIPNVKSKVLITDFLEENLGLKFETIVLNPPYFNRASSRRSPDTRKDLCRSYNEGEITKLVERSLECLASAGSLYIVIRENEALAEIKSACHSKAQMEELLKAGENLFFRITHLNKN